MSAFHSRHLVTLLTYLTLILLLVVAPVWADAIDDRLGKLAGAAGQPEPIMRIGLEAAHSMTLSGTRSFQIVDLDTGAAVWKPAFKGSLSVVAEGGPVEGAPSIFRIQVGAFADKQSAEQEKQRLEQLAGVSGVVHHDPDRGNWRVRLGGASSRSRLEPLVDRLRDSGLQGLWIAEEPATSQSGVSLRLVDEHFDSLLTGHQRLALIPLSGGFVDVEGTLYRGVIELRVTGYGTVRAINWVNLEKYLLGVVPAELGPEVWPEIEALKAQAVAARTYAWRNRGQFGEEGYDLCATPRCQVYKGKSAEHPLSDRAVLATREMILVHEGKAIIALYTATCGGHTEDGAAIFPEFDQPYLAGVPCRAEDHRLASLRHTVKGRVIAGIVDEAGVDVTRDHALLQVAGVYPAQRTTGSDARQPTSGTELRSWTTALTRLAGLPAPAGAPPVNDSLGPVLAATLADLGWDRRAQTLLSDEDLPALLRDSTFEALAPAEARALAYMALQGILQPYTDGSYHIERQPSQARLSPILVAVGETYRAFGLKEGVVSDIEGSSVRLIRGKSKIRLSLAADPSLFDRVAGKPVAVQSLGLWPGDRVRYRTNPAGVIDFLELRPPVKGVTDDRSSSVYSWEVRKTRRTLEAKIAERVSVGRLKDLKILRRGISGRVVELEFVGTSGSAVVKGFQIRGLLGLRDLLTVIEIQRDPQGEIRAVVFSGKGWGHGVGLCQVGAYGMALRGASHVDILAHYYQGATLQRIE
jgi:stage II sporulation protein D